MSILITGEGLRKLLSDGVIENGDATCVEGVKYDFRLSDRFLKAKHQCPANISDFSITTKEDFCIEPGETVFVLSEEILHLRRNMKAELSHKRKLAHLGILVLGGFCIDPLYDGHLIFGMYNYSNHPFLLKKNRKLIAAQFYSLTEEETADFEKPQSLMDFPDDLIQIAVGMRPISLQGLENKLDDISRRIFKMEDDFQKRENWFKEIQENTNKLLNLTSKLQTSLEYEVQARKDGQDKLQNLIDEEQKMRTNMLVSIRTEGLIRKIAIWLIGIIIAIGFSLGIANIHKLPYFQASPQQTKAQVAQ